MRKEGTAFDLPIAIGFLVATGQLAPEATRGLVLVGELGLDGGVRAVRGLLPVARRVAALAGRDGRDGDDAATLVLPPANVAEAALVRGARLAAPASLAALVEALRRDDLGSLRPGAGAPAVATDADVDFADVRGQAVAKRALEVAAAGGHNVILVGPPGAGKTMLARRLPTILPALAEEEALEVTAIHSVAGLLAPGSGLVPARPFRAPHHSISAAGLVGGGSLPRPGEASLAHHGVLMLDEMLEFPRAVLDGLRQPMEDGRIVLARAAASVAFPARFTLVGAMNPCPCGHAGDPQRACGCAAADVARYRARLSGPLADRVDLHVTVGAVPIAALGGEGAAAAESSAAVRARVEAARARQRARWRGVARVECNAHVPARWLDARGGVSAEARRLLATAAERLGLSARGYHRVLRVARTVADLGGSDAVAEVHVAEALRWRPAGAGAGAPR